MECLHHFVRSCGCLRGNINSIKKNLLKKSNTLMGVIFFIVQTFAIAQSFHKTVYQSDFLYLNTIAPNSLNIFPNQLIFSPDTM